MTKHLNLHFSSPCYPVLSSSIALAVAVHVSKLLLDSLNSILLIHPGLLYFKAGDLM